MKAVKIMGLAWLVGWLVAGCSPGRYPAEMRLDGFDNEIPRTRIESIQVQNSLAVIRCSDRIVRVAPVDLKCHLSTKDTYFLSGRITYAPDGPTKVLRIERGDDPIILVFHHARRGWRVLDGYEIEPGATVQSGPSSGRYWTDLRIISEDGPVRTIRPGGDCTVPTSSGSWRIFLVGASVAKPERTGTADEAPDFTADLFIVKSTK